MSRKVKVGSASVRFDLTWGNKQGPLAQVSVSVPVYTEPYYDIGNKTLGYVTAEVPDDFNKKVEQAFQVFADTLQASFRNGVNDENH